MALTTVPASLSATALTLTTAAQPNITSVGTLTGLTVSGNIAGTLTTAAQTNITSVGTLTSLATSGDIAATKSSGDLIISGTASAAGNYSSVRAVNNSGTIVQLLHYGSSKATYGALSSGGSSVYSNAAELVLMADNGSGIIKFATGGNAERMRITSSGEIVTGGLTSSTSQLHLYKADSTGGKLTLQSQVAANATAAITLMSRLADNSNKNVTLEAYRGNLSITGDSGYGNVGIGTTPDSDVKLHIKGDGARVYVDSADYNLISLGRRGSSGVNLDQAYLRMKSAGTNTVVIDTAGVSYFNGGNVGIGVSNPLSPLSVQADTGAVAARFIGRSADSIAGVGFYNSAQDSDIYLQSNGSWFRSRADSGFHFAKGNTPNTSAAPTDSFTIEGMRVGIGTVNPNTHSQLHIANGPYAFLTLDSTNTGGRQYELFSYASDESFHIYDRTASAYRFTLNELGQVGIGTTNPGKSLVIDSSNADPGLLIIKKNSGNNVAYIGTGSSGTTEYGIMQLMHSGSINVQLYSAGDNWLNGGDVAIGHTSPAAQLDVRDTATATVPLRLETAGGAANNVRPQISMYSQGSNGYHISTVRSNTSSDPYGLVFTENTTERMRINSSGNLAFPAGKGIDFSAHASTTASGTAQQVSVLDDYEEGTWTPFWFGTGTGSGVPMTSSQQKGSYVKIGNLVHLSWYVGASANPNNATGSIQLGGMPYSATGSYGTNQAIVTGSCMVSSLDLGSGYSWIVPYLANASSQIAFYQSGDNIGWTQVPLDTSFTMIGEITYRVS